MTLIFSHPISIAIHSKKKFIKLYNQKKRERKKRGNGKKSYELFTLFSITILILTNSNIRFKRELKTNIKRMILFVIA